MDNIVLRFGNQVSRDNFSVLWKQEGVFGKFDFKMRRLYFFFSHLSVEYKFEISYANIGKIELRRPCGQATKFLLIQLFGAPRVFEKDVSDGQCFEWVRGVDFTPSCCIGQSYTLCLELPNKLQLPELHIDFVHYKENEDQLELMEGSPFSCSSGLVPIVNPPTGFDLPYNILFKINSLIQHGCVPGPAIDDDFYRLVDPKRIKVENIEFALDKIFHLKDCCYEPVKWLKEQYERYAIPTRLPRTTAISLDDGLVYVHRVRITPSKVYFCGPEVNLSNRVLRNYPEDIDNFLRVSFVDEDLDKLRSMALSLQASSTNEDKATKVYERIISTLRNGIVIGDKKFEFLALSSDYALDNSIWMFASRPGLTAADIREWMGDFQDIKNVAKYCSNLRQSFCSSRETSIVGRDEIEVILDIEVTRGEVTYCFSDGVGKISEELACKVATKLGCSFIPSAFQIQYGGYKGVVAVDPTSSVKLSLRKSMFRYKSFHTKLDVLAWSKFEPCFLNRQIITLLSYLGVKDEAFQKRQWEAIDLLNAMLTDPLRAQEALEMMFSEDITKVLKEMLLCDYKPDAEPFLSMMLQTFHASKLMDMRFRTWIFNPNGRFMMGCLDETRTLEYGQVFLQVSRFSRQLCNQSSHMFTTSTSNPNKYILEGELVVARNASLHPGDVRVLKAVNVPALHHMVDCVVFPKKGKRPHPNESSGSNLDGDMYFVSWDRDLIPPLQIQPMEYIAAPSTQVDHDVTIKEEEEYFTNHMVKDNLGIIRMFHTVFADREPHRVMSHECMELAKLHSIAIDFPKTGIATEIPPHLCINEYPDFMKKPNKRTYRSRYVIGKLFREVEAIAPRTSPVKAFTLESAKLRYDPDMEVDGFEDFLNDAFRNKTEYDYKLGNLMDYYGIKTEAEILSGNVLKMSKHFDRKRDLDAIKYAVQSLRMEARNWFNEGSDANSTDNAKAKASAWYHVTYHYTYWGSYNEGMNRAHFLSFAWCVYDQLMQIKRDKLSVKALHLPLPEHQFRRHRDRSINETKFIFRQKSHRHRNEIRHDSYRQ
ncbi:probable RNA-dependent RNA polymerase 1 isoform X2 [Juglans microcarpa x Juglans regia]|nr:probable RNA-dependent RNA polymerase 1 isoform X2 [Juglans microcarpa x Juglans regia]XP_041014550.1 probable RNA-dependent RNA polymerase 1 isoform X2 [Juglans microcarpa x Juglans regia]XP_041014551.1 probable RNA-dependent RNA polymerase 1 isoform X2 [Juglans microcarpa x Juglans regia]